MILKFVTSDSVKSDIVQLNLLSYTVYEIYTTQCNSL